MTFQIQQITSLTKLEIILDKYLTEVTELQIQIENIENSIVNALKLEKKIMTEIILNKEVSDVHISKFRAKAYNKRIAI